MLFEEINDVKFKKYSSDTINVSRHIELTKETAESVNKVIAVANKGNKNFKLNSTMVFNVAIKKFFKELEKLSSDEAIHVLRTEALAETGLEEKSN